MATSCQLLLYQMEIEPGAPDDNRRRLQAWSVDMAQRLGPEDQHPRIVCLPELWNTGYRLESLAETADGPGRPSRQVLAQLARRLNAWVVGGSVAERDADGGVANRTVVLRPDGGVVATYDKIHRFSPAAEDRYLKAGSKPLVVSIPHAARSQAVRCGIMICYDLRFGALARGLAGAGADVLFVPAHWPQVRRHHWQLLLKARAVEHQLFVVGCNAVSTVDDTVFAGDSAVIDPWGSVLAAGGEDEGTLDLVLDLDAIARVRRQLPVGRDATCLGRPEER